jgi:hypothetical protein
MLYLEGRATAVREVEHLDGGRCQITFNPVFDPRLKKFEAAGFARWVDTGDITDVWLTISLSRNLWEDLWRRSMQPPAKCMVWTEMAFADGLPRGEQAIVTDPIIRCSSN